MAGNEDDDTIFNDWYINFLEKRKDNLRGQYVATANVQTEATKKLGELMDQMKDCDAQLAKCTEVAKRKSKEKKVIPEGKGKEPDPGSNYDTPIKIECDSDEEDEPVRMIRYVGVQGEPSKIRDQCGGGKLAFDAEVKGGEADMDISDDEDIVKHVIDSTVAAFSEAEEEEPIAGVQSADAVQQGLQQQQERGSQEEAEEESEEEQSAEEEDSWYNNDSEEDIGYPYHYHSPEVSHSNSDAYGFNSD
ncbi:cilia- and flagella-associated protein 251-like [Chenopodium quinoa]|uniref:cilia- and flagella-associated protein 251-like n=1 Tax=Chenopodium quinoa TaxID=63459 RepID=UPI000B7859A0|nr:cilia- and flagella-associated protein 251-like [Chenopodium quinoa]